jgi:hypothetical protein
MTPELREHLRNIIEDAIERAEDHLDWLARHPQEPDREAQISDTERSIALSKQWFDLHRGLGSLPA